MRVREADFVLDGFLNSLSKQAAPRQPGGSLLKEVQTAWETLRNDNALPARSDLDPRLMRRALPNAFVLDCTNPEAATFRIAGSKLSERAGTSLRGQPVTSILAPSERPEFFLALKDVCRLPAKADVRFFRSHGTALRLDAKMILLPMVDEAGAVTRILGCYEALTNHSAGGFNTGVDSHWAQTDGNLHVQSGHLSVVVRPLSDTAANVLVAKSKSQETRVPKAPSFEVIRNPKRIMPRRQRQKPPSLTLVSSVM